MTEPKPEPKPRLLNPFRAAEVLEILRRSKRRSYNAHVNQCSWESAHAVKEEHNALALAIELILKDRPDLLTQYNLEEIP